MAPQPHEWVPPPFNRDNVGSRCWRRVWSKTKLLHFWAFQDILRLLFFSHHIFAPPPQILSFAASYHIGVERWWVYYYKTKETIQPGVQDCWVMKFIHTGGCIYNNISRRKSISMYLVSQIVDFSHRSCQQFWLDWFFSFLYSYSHHRFYSNKKNCWQVMWLKSNFKFSGSHIVWLKCF